MKTIVITESQFRHLIKHMVVFELAKMGIEMPDYSIVHHKKDSTDDSQVWKEYWEKNHNSHHFPSEPHICPSCLLKKDDFVGGHVVCDSETFIIPVCRECNSEYKGDNADNHPFYVNTEDMVKVIES